MNTTLLAIADPNADLETWIKNCPRPLLERMYILMFTEASKAIEAKERAEAQFKNLSDLPDKYHEGVYSIRRIKDRRQPYYIASFDSIRSWIANPAIYQDEVEEFLKELVE